MSPTGNGTGRTAWKFWVYAGLIIGGSVSIAANIGYTFIPPRAAPPWWPPSQAWNPSDYSPQPGDVAFAVFCPVAIFILTEVITRPRWRDGRLSQLVRAASAVMVGLPVAVASYLHLCTLLMYYSNIPAISYTLPLTVDGLMLACTAALQMTEHGSDQVMAPGPHDAVIPRPRESADATAAPDSGPAESDDDQQPVDHRPMYEGFEAGGGTTLDRITAVAAGNDGQLPVPMQDAKSPTGGPEYAAPLDFVLLPVPAPVATEPTPPAEPSSTVGVAQSPPPLAALPVPAVESPPVAFGFAGSAVDVPTGNPDEPGRRTGQEFAEPPAADLAPRETPPDPQEPEPVVFSDLDDAELIVLAMQRWPPGEEITAGGMRRSFGVGTGRARRLRDALKAERQAVPMVIAADQTTPGSDPPDTNSDVITVTSGFFQPTH